MTNNKKGLLPPDFCDVLTLFKREKCGYRQANIIKRCKFSKDKTEFSGDVLGGVNHGFYARVPLGQAEVIPGDILVKGRVYLFPKKEENGEDILKKYPHTAFRVTKVSFCGNHIYVKG